jgi:hypothetical protein
LNWEIREIREIREIGEIGEIREIREILSYFIPLYPHTLIPYTIFKIYPQSR